MSGKLSKLDNEEKKLQEQLKKVKAEKRKLAAAEAKKKEEARNKWTLLLGSVLVNNSVTHPDLIFNTLKVAKEQLHESEYKLIEDGLIADGVIHQPHSSESM